MNREEFEKFVADNYPNLDPINQYFIEKGRRAFKTNGEYIGTFYNWLKKHKNSNLRRLFNDIYNEEEDQKKRKKGTIIEVCTKDLQEYYLKQIPEEYYEKKVFLTDEYPDSKARGEVVRILNKRWIFKQLGLNIQKTDKREIFYKVRKSLGGVLDLKGTKKQQQGSISQAIDVYYKYIKEHLEFKYWGYVPDYLEVGIKGTAIIFDINMEEIILTKKNLTKFKDVPFFLVICEKTILIDFTMRELINRGYDKGFYGIALGGYPVSAVIKYLIPFSKIRNFYVFVQHDLDVDGLKIYFDIKKWFPCESVGVNPEFLKHIGVDFEDIAEDYNVTEKQKKKQELGAINMVLELDISKEEKEKYSEWINFCSERRAEINSLLTKREDEDYTKNKARDFCDYLISLIEDPERPWNLTRYKKPTYNEPYLGLPDILKPKFILDVVDEIDKKTKAFDNKFQELSNKITENQNKIYEEAYKKLDDYLDSKKLRKASNWSELIKDKVDELRETNKSLRKLLYRVGKFRRRRILRENKRYKGKKVIKNAWNIINHQSKQLSDLTSRQTESLKKIVEIRNITYRKFIIQTPEYKELKKDFKENREDFIKAIEPKGIIKSLRKELIKILKEPIKFEELEDEEIDDEEIELEEIELEDEEIDEDEIEVEELEDE